jgi:hypothetical protein
LETLRTLLDLSHFKAAQESLDITALPNWPLGQITLHLLKFPVEFQAELPAGGTKPIQVEDMTLEDTVEDAWALLHHTYPRLFEHATFNDTGRLRRGLSIESDVRREMVPLAVRFQVIDKRFITYEPRLLNNMWTQEEVWDRYFHYDRRLSPFELDQEWEERPYVANTRLGFMLKDVSTAVNTLGRDGGVSGGMGPDRWMDGYGHQ